MAFLAQSPRLRKLLLSAGTAGCVAAAVLGGYRYVAAPPAPPVVEVEAPPIAPALPADGAARCTGKDPVPGALGAVCKRPVAGEQRLLQP